MTNEAFFDLLNPTFPAERASVRLRSNVDVLRAFFSSQPGIEVSKSTLHWVPLSTSSVVTSRFLCLKILDCNVKKFGYNKHLLIMNSFFCIFILIVSRRRLNKDLVKTSTFSSAQGISVTLTRSKKMQKKLIIIRVCLL